MPNFVYPTAAELKEVEQELMPRLMLDRPIFELMPIVNVDSHIVEWEQEDNYLGLQQVRGLNGAPQSVKRVGGKRFQMTPGVYGEFIAIDEHELTTRRRYGSFSEPVDISDLVMRSFEQLLQRRLDRIEKIGWDLLSTGTFSVSNSLGVVHTDTFTLQTHAGSDWSVLATATPIKDNRDMVLKGRGKGVSFGRGARAFINRKTANLMLNNTNDADLHGQRVGGGNTNITLEDINKVLIASDLPTYEVYDDGFLDDAGAFQPFIPDDKVVIAGRRTGGMRISDYAMTRNANNPSMAPGAYTKVVDNVTEDVPRSIKTHDGHNGGPRIYFPSAVVIMSV